MADIKDITLQINTELKGFDQLKSALENLKKDTTISPIVKNDIDSLLKKLELVGPALLKQWEKGKINLKQLGLGSITKEAEIVLKNVGKNFTINFDPEKINPIKQSVAELTSKLAKVRVETDNAGLALDKVKNKRLALAEEVSKSFGLKGISKIQPDLNIGGAQEKISMLKEEAGANQDVKILKDIENQIAAYEEYIKKVRENRAEHATANKEFLDASAKKKTALNELKTAQEQLDKAEIEAQKNGNTPENIQQLRAALGNYNKAKLNLNLIETDINEERRKGNKVQEEGNNLDQKSIKGFAAKAAASYIYFQALNAIKGIINSSIRTVKELDKAMTEAAIVTDMNRKEAWKLLDSYQALAKQTGLTTSEISNIAVEFIKQGRNVTDAMKLAEVAAKSAKIAGIDAKEAVNYLTSAVNGFGLAASEAEGIADKFAAISANSATDFEELAIAMSKVSPSAKSAGVGVDFMMGVLAKGLETTREAPENIGTAFKTIFARMREITDLGKATEDGMSLNRVEKALASVDVKLRDTSGQFRNLETVLLEVGDKWSTLTSLEQAYLATALAGTRQQPRLLAIFNDFERTRELIEISAEATGELMFQHLDYMNGIEASTARMKTAWEGVITSFVSSEPIIFVLDTISNTLELFSAGISSSTDPIQAMIGLLGLLAGTMITIDLLRAKAAITQDNLNKAGKKSLIIEAGKLLFGKQNISFLLKKAVADRLEALNKAKLITAEAAHTAALEAYNNAKARYILLESHGASATVLDAAAKKMATAAQVVQTKQINIDTVSTNINTVAKKANMLVTLGWIGLGIAVVAGLVAIVYYYTSANKQLERNTKLINENNKAIAESKGKKKSIEDLIEEFNKLDKKILKTKEDSDRMSSILDELSSIEFNDKTYNLTTELFGETIIDTAAYESFMNDVNKKISDNTESTSITLSDSINLSGAEALNDPTTLNAFLNIGYNYGLKIIEGIKDADIRANITKVLGSQLKGLNVKDFVAPKEVVNFSELNEQDLKNELLGFYRNTLSDEKYTELTKKSADEVAEYFNLVIRRTVDDEGWFGKTERYQIEGMTSAYYELIDSLVKQNEIFYTSMQVIDMKYKGLETNATNLTNKINEQVTAFTERLAEIDEIKDKNVRANVLIQFKQSNEDTAILYTLIKEQRIPVELIVSMNLSGLNVTQISNIFNNILPTIDYSVLNEEWNHYTQTAVKDIKGDLYDILQLAFDGKNLASVFSDYAAYLDEYTTMTAAEISSSVITLYNSLGVKSNEAIASMIKNSYDSASSLVSINEDLIKGDFTSYAEAVAAYGIDAVNDFLSGTDEGIRSFYEAQNETIRQDILNKTLLDLGQIYQTAGKNLADEFEDATGTNIEDATFQQILDFANSSEILNDLQKESITLSGIMFNNLDKVSGQQLIFNTRIEETNKLLEKQSGLKGLITLRNSIKDLGIETSAFLDVLDEMIDIEVGINVTGGENTLNAAFAVLETLGSFDEGVFTFNPNVSKEQAELAFNNIYEAAEAYISVLEIKSKESRDIIEKSFKEQTDALKEGFNQRWDVIEANNKIAESENKIIEIRQKLYSLSLSGASSVVLKQTQADLRKLEEERMKLLEQESLKRAEKQLEVERDNALIKVQNDLNNNLSALNGNIVSWIKAFNEFEFKLPVTEDDTTAETTTINSWDQTRMIKNSTVME